MMSRRSHSYKLSLLFVWVLALHTVASGQETSIATDPAAEDALPTIVFVHGAWGGKHQWKTVATKVAAATKLQVYRASLTGLGERTHLASPSVDLETHIQDVTNLIEREELNEIILIGHSYGGMVISGVADKLHDRISNLLFLDAYLPNDGDNFFSQHPQLQEKLIARSEADGDGWKIPVDWPNPMGDAPHPLKTLTQSIKLDVKKISRIPSHYWLFTDGKPKQQDKLLCYFQRAAKRGYSTKSFNWGHNPHRNHIDEFVLELSSFCKEIASSKQVDPK